MTIDQQVLNLINQERSNAGLSPLSWNSQLDSAAERHSQDMGDRDFFDHRGSDGSSPSNRINQSGYSGSPALAGTENIGVGYPTPAAVIQGWMNSNMGHREAILNPDADDIGVGYYYLENDTGSENWNHYWTVTFGTSDGAVPSAPNPAQNPYLLPREFELGHIALNSLGTETITRTGWVGDSDTADTYHFSASGRNDGVRIEVSLTGLSSDADIRLIEDRNRNQIVDIGEVIESSTLGSTSNESFSTYLDNFDLANYDYFVQVYQYSGDTNYDLNMTFQSTIG